MLKKGDIILLAAVLVIVVAGLAAVKYYKSNDTGARIAVIKQDDKVVRKIDLNGVTAPERINIEGKYPGTILVERGRIRFEQADCPDKVCVKTGWLSKKGDAAYCLPNKTSIRIEGADSGIDGVAY